MNHYDIFLTTKVGTKKEVRSVFKRIFAENETDALKKFRDQHPHLAEKEKVGNVKFDVKPVPGTEGVKTKPEKPTVSPPEPEATETEPIKVGPDTLLIDVPNIPDAFLKLLNDAGYNTVADVQMVGVDELVKIKGIGRKSAAQIMEMIAFE